VRFLLDTHVWLWAVSAPERLGDQAREVLTAADNELLLSAASVWEISIKVGLGKLTLPEPPDLFVPGRMARDRITALPVTVTHALAVANLPFVHRDPFDRMLVAQAKTEDLPFLTADPVFLRYDVEVLPADR
jgi:PIN domain nuclease of toxin-antitoxin system